MSAAAVDIQGLTKQFGDLTAVDGVELAVRPGEIFALIGADGAGKTTLLRMLAGIMLPTAGTALVAGHDVVKSPEAVKQRIGYLAQRFALYTDLTIEENIDFVARLYQTPHAEAERLKHEMLDLTGLAPFAKRQAGRLSGGMKQKLGLTCALIHRPEVLLLDEPTTGVDPISRRDFYRILATLPDQGVTVLLSSPYMDEAERCHRLALMSRGRILAAGTGPELVAQVAGHMFEVVIADVRGAAAALSGLADLLGQTPFGDCLHVRLAADDGAQRITQHLTAAGLKAETVKPIEPSVEDVFVALAGGA